MFLWQYLAPLLLIAVHKGEAQGCHEFTDLDIKHSFIGTSVKIRLLLYTRENSTCGQLLSHTNLSANPQFDLSKPTIFIIHGYRPTGSPPMWLNKLEELLLEKADVNLIVVDWNSGAANLNYFKAVENTHLAAENLTAFIELMDKQGASLDTIHMIGISLGAHISGFVGANLMGRIGRITGLDPAGPQFTGTSTDKRLDFSDAQFVDVLHTDIDALGFREPLGHIDFYANGGTDQPGCPKTIFSGGAYFKCDHQRSVLLFMESINGTCSSKAFPCASYKNFLDGECLSCERFGAAGCPIFGYDVTKWKDILIKERHTKTFFTTNGAAPFCMTNYRVDVMIWNEEDRWGYLTIKLYGTDDEATATIDHTAAKFKKFTETRLFAHFDKDVGLVKKVSVSFTTGNVLKPTYKLRVLRMRLTHLEREERPLCRYDILLKEKQEVSFRPIPCEESNF